MPLKLRRRPKRPLFKRKRFTKRKSTVPRAPNSHTFIRQCQYTTQTIAAGAGSGVITGAQLFRLNDLPSYTDFESLYDQFRINWVKIRFENRFNVANLEGNGSAVQVGLPRIALCADYDDVNPPAGFNELRERRKTRYHTFTPERNSFSMTLKPRVLKQAYQTALLTSYIPETKPTWVDMTYYNTPHFGVKFALQIPFNGSLPYAVPFDIFATMSITCKNPR